ncbi:MAG: phosphatase PAP2 family protein [Amoebophilaceae bacterium]|nr:phosphatase PAP2 family protein [Amoebophilaceae bacterium]
MATFGAIWRENKHFGFLIFVLFSVGLLPLLLWDRVAFFLMIKQWNHPIVDGIAPYITHLGNGATYLFWVFILVLDLLYYAIHRANLCLELLPNDPTRLTYAVLTGSIAPQGSKANKKSIGLPPTKAEKVLIWGSSFGCMFIVVQFLKRVVFPYVVRPMELLSREEVHVVDGVKLFTELSFPSGHAGTIFTMITVIQLLQPKKSWFRTIGLALLACVVAYSRIYLCHHFYTDVYFGALIGTVAACIGYHLSTYFCLAYWLDRSIYFLWIKYGKALLFFKK